MKSVLLKGGWPVVCGLILLLPALLSAAGGLDVDKGWIAATASSILALDSARKTVLQERDALPGDSAERLDSRDFIHYLNARIGAYCKQLIQGGALAELERLPCPAATRSTGQAKTAAGGVLRPPALTRSERTAQLDRELRRSLGDFDEMLAREEAKAAARPPKRRESSGGAGGSAGSGTAAGTVGAAGQKAGEETAALSGERNGEVAGAERSAAEVRAGGRGGPPRAVMGGGRKLPPPEDDDIVARQLREAAEKEPDPELKRKLWEEYWKYKGVDVEQQSE